MPLDELLVDGQDYAVHHGDCVEHMATLPDACIDFSVWSPPFPSLFAYTSESCDIGNSEDLRGEAKIHLSFFLRQFARLLKPGRICVIHCMQIPGLARNGEKGTFDFRGLLIRLAQRAGLIYQYDWLVRKNPQALKNGTPVLTPTGWQRIELIKPGDMVIGSDGQSTSVTGVYHHEARQMFRMSFSDGTAIDCDANHLWQVETVNGPSRVMATREIIKQGVVTPSGDRRFCIPILSAPARLDVGETCLIDPYTLGCILGDGGITSRSCAFITTEHEVVAAAKLPEKHKWRRIKGSDKAGGAVGTYIALGDRWHNNVLLSELRRIGLHGKRAWEKFVPHEYLFAPAEQRLQLLRGLMDTDGTIKTRSGIVCKFCSTSERLAADVVFLAQSLGGVARMDVEVGGSYVYKGRRRIGRQKYCVSLRMPAGICPFGMARKALRWRPTKKAVCRYIKSIDPVGVSECTCIEVDAADKLYVTEHCIVTHNSQAIRTHSHKLLFVSLERDRAISCGAMGDYLIKLIAPGENKTPINSKEITREQWIDWAECCWTDIRETDTLNTREAKGENDTKHICPLQLGVIERLVKLYSNPGEIVFSPFAGIGSEGYVSLKLGRRFYGCELKKEYYETCLRNLKRAKHQREESQRTMFDEITA